MDKNERRKEIRSLLNKDLQIFYEGSGRTEFVDKIISQEEAMIKAAEDKAVLEFAKEFIEFHKTGYGYHCGNSMTDLRIDNLITEIKVLLKERGITETV